MLHFAPAWAVGLLPDDKSPEGLGLLGFRV